MAGGGPHALACAALLAGRCEAAATIAGLGPADAPDLDWVAGMGEGNIAEVAAAREGRERLTSTAALTPRGFWRPARCSSPMRFARSSATSTRGR
jgi:hypothetical protein